MNIYGKVDSWGVFHICSSCTMCTHWIGFPGFVTIQRQAFIWWICVYTCTHLDSSLGCPGMSWDVLVQNDPQLTQESTDLLLAGRQERYGNAFGMKLDPSHQFAITIPNETTERVFDRSYGHLVVSHSLKTNMYNIYIYILSAHVDHYPKFHGDTTSSTSHRILKAPHRNPRMMDYRACC